MPNLPEWMKNVKLNFFKNLAGPGQEIYFKYSVNFPAKYPVVAYHLYIL